MNDIERAIQFLKHLRDNSQYLQAYDIPTNTAISALEFQDRTESTLRNNNYSSVNHLLLTASRLIEKQRWIPVNERLPESKINPVLQDYYEYQCTTDWGIGRIDVRHYKFGDGHWWHSGSCMDNYVTAWRENPSPYTETQKEDTDD